MCLLAGVTCIVGASAAVKNFCCLLAIRVLAAARALQVWGSATLGCTDPRTRRAGCSVLGGSKSTYADPRGFDGCRLRFCSACFRDETAKVLPRAALKRPRPPCTESALCGEIRTRAGGQERVAVGLDPAQGHSMATVHGGPGRFLDRLFDTRGTGRGASLGEGVEG